MTLLFILTIDVPKSFSLQKHRSDLSSVYESLVLTLVGVCSFGIVSTGLLTTNYQKPKTSNERVVTSEDRTLVGGGTVPEVVRGPEVST